MRIHKYIAIFFVLFSYCYLDTVATPLMLEGEDIEVYANRKKKESTDSTNNNKKKKELGKITNFIYNTIRITPRNPAAEQRLLERENNYVSNYTGRTIGEIYIYQNNVFENSNKWVDRTLNSLHRVTREEVIRNDLFFKSGDTINPVEIANNRRLLRSRPYFSDVNIIIVPRAEDTTIVDMYVLTRDKWTISADLKIKSDGKTQVMAYDDNLLGWGSRLSISTYVDWKHGFTYGGNLVEYTQRNIVGSFWDAYAVVGKGFDNANYGAEFTREFIHPTDYMAGASFMYERELLNYYPPDTMLHASWTMLDVWGGYAVEIPAMRNSLYMTARFFNLKYTDRPEVTDMLNPYFHNNAMLIGSIGFFKERFRLTNRIYGYGVPEDVAYGYHTAFLAGYSWGEFGNRWYLGGEFSAGYFTPIGYLGTEAGLGSYLNSSNGKFYRTTLQAKLTYFTPLLGQGRYPVRQFIVLNATRGWNRLDGFQETLKFNSYADMRALEEDVYGINRMVLNTETVVFTPWQVAQFKIAGFFFADFGLLGNSGNIFKNNFFTTLGIGFRIKNENLIFNTINIQLGVAFNKAGLMNSRWFDISNRRRNDPIRYRPVKAEPIEYY